MIFQRRAQRERRRPDMAARDRRPPDASDHRPGDVRLHLFALLQPRARRHFLRRDGSVVEVPRGLLAAAGGQRYALYCGRHPFLARAVGALSAASFSLYRRRTGPASTRLEHSALACRSFWRPTADGRAVRYAAVQLCHAAVRLLGQRAVQYRDPVHLAHRRLDARLHRSLFLAADEVVLRLGGAVSSRHCHPAADAGDDRRAPCRARSRPARRRRRVAQGEPAERDCPAGAGDQEHRPCLFPARLCRGDRARFRCARRALLARASEGPDRDFVSRPAGARAEGRERPRSLPALQHPACQRVWWPGALLDLPHSRPRRRQRPAAAVRARGVCARSRRRHRQPVDPSRLPAAA